jgi:hypothetical protein
MTDSGRLPTRHEVDDVWAAVAEGRMTREEAHDWAEVLMFSDELSDDVMAMSAVQHVHGLDMTYRSEDGRLIGHGPPGAYVRTLAQVQADLDQWRGRCREFDTDPEGFRERNQARVRQHLRDEGIRPKDADQEER